MKIKDNDKLIDCPIEIASSIVGGKWKCVILFRLVDNTIRFNELLRSIDGITRRMLTLQLRELETLGVVHRKVYHQVPPKVEYSLTSMGRELKPILNKLKQWGEKYIEAKKQEKVTSSHNDIDTEQ